MDEGVDLLALAETEGGLPPGSLGRFGSMRQTRGRNSFFNGEMSCGEKEISQILDIDLNGIRLRVSWIYPFFQRSRLGSNTNMGQASFVSAFAEMEKRTRFYCSDEDIQTATN